MASQNADVALAYLNEPDDARLTKKKGEAEGRQYLLISGDVTVQKFCDRAVARTIKECGLLEVLVNNGCISGPTHRG